VPGDGGSGGTAGTARGDIGMGLTGRRMIMR
jgi:hypothetical protein